MIASFVLCYISIHDGHSWGDDFALYLDQAKALLQGTTWQLYESNKYTTEQSSILLGPYLYPPGASFLLSIIYAFTGLNFVAIKIYCSLFFIGSLPLMFYIFRGKFQAVAPALFIAAIISVHPAFTAGTDEILSDIFFFFFCMLSFAWMEYAYKPFHYILLGVLIFYSYITRDVGIFLLPTLFVYQLIHKKERWYWSVCPYIVFLLLVAVKYVLLPHGTPNHMDELNKVSATSLSFNFKFYKYLIADFFLFSREGNPVYKSVFFLLVILGMISSGKKAVHISLFTVLILAMYIVWPAIQGPRFIYPALPFVLFFFVKGSFGVLSLGYLKYLRMPLLLLYAILIFREGVMAAGSFSKKEANEAYTKEMVTIYGYIREHIPTDSKIVFLKPRALHLFTQRVGFVKGSAEEALSSDASYYLTSMKDAFPVTDAFRVQLATENYVLYKIER